MWQGAVCGGRVTLATRLCSSCYQVGAIVVWGGGHNHSAGRAICHNVSDFPFCHWACYGLSTTADGMARCACCFAHTDLAEPRCINSGRVYRISLYGGYAWKAFKDLLGSFSYPSALLLCPLAPPTPGQLWKAVVALIWWMLWQVD